MNLNQLFNEALDEGCFDFAHESVEQPNLLFVPKCYLSYTKWSVEQIAQWYAVPHSILSSCSILIADGKIYGNVPDNNDMNDYWNPWL